MLKMATDASELVYRQESYKVIGACFEAYKNRGVGFTEPVYQECLQIEFDLQQIPFVAQPELQLAYKGRSMTQTFKPDFVCYGKIIVELKALEKLNDAHRSQSLNYLHATEFELALLVNFGGFPRVEYERIVNTRNIAKMKGMASR